MFNFFRITLNWVTWKWNIRVWPGLFWLKIWSSGGLLWKLRWSFVYYKRREIPWKTGKIFSPQQLRAVEHLYINMKWQANAYVVILLHDTQVQCTRSSFSAFLSRSQHCKRATSFVVMQQRCRPLYGEYTEDYNSVCILSNCSRYCTSCAFYRLRVYIF